MDFVDIWSTLFTVYFILLWPLNFLRNISVCPVLYHLMFVASSEYQYHRKLVMLLASLGAHELITNWSLARRLNYIFF